MKIKFKVFSTVFVGTLAALTLVGCSAESGDDEAEDRVIERVEVSDNKFKPVELEETIDGLVSDLVEAGASEDASVGIVLKELVDFWRPVVVGANRALGELDILGSVTGSANSGGDDAAIQEQIDFVTGQQDSGLRSLGIAPFGDEATEIIDKLVADGIPVITIDSDLADSDRMLYIGTDNTEGGKTGGETLRDLIDADSGRVIILGNTDEGWVDGYSRTTAAVEVLEDAGFTVEVTNSTWDDTQVDVLLELIADDSIDEPLVGMLGIFANAHTLGTAALEAELDEMPKIVAFDFDDATLVHMENGVIQATHAQRQYYMGYLSMYLLYSIQVIGLDATKAAVKEHLLKDYHVDTGLDVVFAEDVEEYNSFLDELGI